MNRVLRYVRSARKSRSLHEFVIFLFLVLFGYVYRVKRVPLLMELFYRIFPLSATSDPRLLSQARVLEYHKLKRLPQANAITRLILQQYDDGKCRATDDERFETYLVAAYAGDEVLLQEIAARVNFIPDAPGFREYVQALIDFGNGSAGWEQKLYACKTNFRKVNGPASDEAIPEYAEHSSSFLDSGVYSKVLERSYEEASDYKVEQGSNETLVLLSCDVKYFIIYSRYFCKILRRRNLNCILFMVVIDSDADREDINRHARDLAGFGNVKVEIHSITGKIGVAASVFRFLVALRVMLETRDNVMILDIDSSPEFRVDSLVSRMESDLGFTIDESSFVPWARLNAGLCAFKYGSDGLTFLAVLRTYIDLALQDGADWTVDQASLFVTWNWWKLRSGSIHLHNFAGDFSSQRQSSTPRRLQRRKIYAKSLNAPTSGMS